jgi:hypothetical protein
VVLLSWFALAGGCLAWVGLTGLRASDQEVVFTSPTESDGDHGVYRWAVKTDLEVPPDVIPAANKLKPSDVGKWAEPRGHITTNTPRSGREKDWFEITGKVVLVKAEQDGDLHIQLVDADGGSMVNLVVEVPVRQHTGVSPWSDIRTEVFGWTNTTFPLRFTSDRKLDLVKKPVIRVEGKAFFDAQHRDATRPNRRKETGDTEVAVWEIHPVMRLEPVPQP